MTGWVANPAAASDLSPSPQAPSYQTATKTTEIPDWKMLRGGQDEESGLPVVRILIPSPLRKPSAESQKTKPGRTCSGMPEICDGVKNGKRCTLRAKTGKSEALFNNKLNIFRIQTLNVSNNEFQVDLHV